MLEKWSKSSPSQEYVQRLVPELVHHGRRVAIEREQVLVDNHCRGLLSLGNPPHVVNLFLLFPPRLGLGLLNGLSGRGSDTIARTRANEYVEPTNMVPDPAAILSAIPIPDARSNLHPYFGTNTRSCMNEYRLGKTKKTDTADLPRDAHSGTLQRTRRSSLSLSASSVSCLISALYSLLFGSVLFLQL